MTAAGLWAVVAMGMAVGTEQNLLALLTTVLTMLVFVAARVSSAKRRTGGEARQWSYADGRSGLFMGKVHGRKDQPSAAATPR
jgi:uncharacterized membrane protein YhiD involved in acid resistance